MRAVFYRLILTYLRTLAKLQLRKINPLIIGITGSVGKTSALMAIAAVLKDHYKIKISEKANSESGLPLNILGFKPRNYNLIDWLWTLPLALFKLITNWKKHDVYVAEMGIDSLYPPKNMEYLLTILQPKIGVFLNVLPVHTENFGSLGNIAKEKGKLILSLPKDGFAVLNTKDTRVEKFKKLTKARVIEFQGEATEAAVAIAKIFNINKTRALASLAKNFKPIPGRMSLIPGIKNTTLIDSSYNASRASMLKALDCLAKTGKGKKIAVLGDMRELGNLAQKEHENIAMVANKIADTIVTIGPLMKQFFIPKTNNLFQFENTYEAADFIKNKLIQGGETILIKGSQNTLFLEIITETLMREPEKADQLLCRRGKFWDKKRATIKL